MVTINPDRTDKLIDALTKLWEASVRSTHHFLTEDDIQKLTLFVKTGLSGIETLVVASENHNPIAFMGIEARKVEMLFVSPDYFGKGVGRQMAELAISQYEVQYVDVNEQNPKALAFYLHAGFEITARSEQDGQGWPYPLLHMSLPTQV